MFKYLTIATGVLLSSGLAPAAAAGAPNNGILGYLSPDGAFRPVAPPASSAPTTVAPTTGVITGIFSFVVSNDVPATATNVSCGLSAFVMGPDNVTELSSAVVARSGNIVTCTVKIAYKWSLPNLASDSLYLTGNASISDGAGAMRSSSLNFGVMAIPASGASTIVRYSGIL